MLRLVAHLGGFEGMEDPLEGHLLEHLWSLESLGWGCNPTPALANP